MWIVKFQSLQLKYAASHHHQDEQNGSATYYSPMPLPARRCGNHSFRLTVPGWMCLIDGPQPVQYFAAATPALQALTTSGFRHLQCFP